MKSMISLFGLVLVLCLVPEVEAADAIQGQEPYIRYCSSCHGKDGKGNGAVSPFLKVSIPDLTVLKKNHQGIYPLDKVMRSIDSSRKVHALGEPTMPVWGEVFRKESGEAKYPELTSLLKAKVIAEYVATLQK